MAKPDPKKCGAKNRQGKPCGNQPMPNGRCYMHGGKSAKGMAAGTFKHGRYSKYLPKLMGKTYVESLNDKQLLSLRDEIALVDTAIKDLLSQLNTGETGAAWKSIHEQAKACKQAEKKFRQDKSALSDWITATRDLISEIESGFADWRKWQELGSQIDRRARVAAAEHKRLIDLEVMIPADRATMLVLTVAGIVKQHVTDAKILSEISDGLRAVLSDVDDGVDTSVIEADDG